MFASFDERMERFKSLLLGRLTIELLTIIYCEWVRYSRTRISATRIIAQPALLHISAGSREVAIMRVQLYIR